MPLPQTPLIWSTLRITDLGVIDSEIMFFRGAIQGLVVYPHYFLYDFMGSFPFWNKCLLQWIPFPSPKWGIPVLPRWKMAVKREAIPFHCKQGKAEFYPLQYPLHQVNEKRIELAWRVSHNSLQIIQHTSSSHIFNDIKICLVKHRTISLPYIQLKYW